MLLGVAYGYTVAPVGVYVICLPPRNSMQVWLFAKLTDITKKPSSGASCVFIIHDGWLIWLMQIQPSCLTSLALLSLASDSEDISIIQGIVDAG